MATKRAAAGSPADSVQETPLPRALIMVLAATALIYGAIVFLSVRPYHGNLTSLMYASDRNVADDPASLGHHVIVFLHTNGYDGLAYYRVADDPFLQHPNLHDAFRYQRIGYPLVVWAVSLGRRDWRPAALVGVNMAAVLAIAAISVLLLRLYAPGSSPWWALACAVNPSLIIGIGYDLAEPMTLALGLTAILFYLRRQLGWATLTLALAMLTREVAVLFLLPLLAAELLARRWRSALLLLPSVLPYLVWQLVLLRAFHQASSSTSENNFDRPLRGVASVIDAARHTSLRNALVHEGSVLAIVAFVVAALIVAAIYGTRRYDVVWGGMFVHSIAALFAGTAIWIAFASAARVFGGLYPLTVLAFARQRGAATGALVAWLMLMAAFTVVRFVAISPHLSYYVTP